MCKLYNRALKTVPEDAGVSESIGGVHGCALGPRNTRKYCCCFVIWYGNCVVFRLSVVRRFPPLSIQNQTTLVPKADLAGAHFLAPAVEIGPGSVPAHGAEGVFSLPRAPALAVKS